MSLSWEDAAMKLAESLHPPDGLDDEWRAAFASVPRHLFVPRYHDPATRRWVSPVSVEQFANVYRDVNLVTQMRFSAPGDAGAERATSSSSMPGIMAWMVQASGLRRGQKVLEIGTGTGYNAAVLCHRLGPENVTSIDIDPDVVDAARNALAGIGFHPTLRAADGNEGDAATGPFDAIVSTASVDHVPPAWIEQLKPGGRIVTDLRGNFSGAMTLLTKTDDDTVTGRCHTLDAAFMPMRRNVEFPARSGPTEPFELRKRNPQRRPTEVDPNVVLTSPALRFVTELQIGGGGTDVFLAGDELVVGSAWDGSWAVVPVASPNGDRTVVCQGGPRRLWDSVEAAVDVWRTAGRPDLDAYGVTADLDVLDQVVWLNEPDGPFSWPLPI